MTMRVCAYRTLTERCTELTTSTYCERHDKQRRKQSDRRRPNAAQRGYDARWQRTRARYLRLHPLCVECAAPATDVHHLDGLGPNGPRGHDETNLEALCHEHHSMKTAKESPAGWNR